MSHEAFISSIRVGNGYDLHQLEAGEAITLGGLVISCPYRLRGHSDADVLLHSITDAVLGALALGDIGEWFPDTDPSYRGADSGVLFKTVWQKAIDEGWYLINLDCVIIAETPKLSPYKKQLRQSIADLFGADLAQVNVKATTNEACDAIGRKEAIGVHSVVLLGK